jgi:hypothetical protein
MTLILPWMAPGDGVEFVPAIKIVETAPGGNAVIL